MADPKPAGNSGASSAPKPAATTEAPGNASGFRTEIVAAIAVVCLLVGWLLHGVLVVPPDIPTMKVFEGWRLGCPTRAQTDRFCALSEQVSDKRSGTLLVNFVLSRPNGKPRLDFTMPYDVLLPAGFGIKIGDDPMKTFAYRTCVSGCIVTVYPDDKLYNTLIGAKQVRVYFANLGRRVIPVELPLTGFSTALAEMNDTEARRHSWLRRAFL